MNIPPRPGPEWRFCPPPGWPTPPEGWVPSPAWGGPEDDWPEAPPYWIWWVRDPDLVSPAAPASLPPRIEPAPRTLLWPLVALGLASASLAGAIVYVTHVPGASAPVAATKPTDPVTPVAPPPSTASPAASASRTVTGPEAREQAFAIDDLLDESAPSRGRLGPAIAKVSRCSGVASGVKAIEEVTRQREEQAGQARRLNVDALPAGEELKGALVEALEASHRADKAYLKWAKRFKAGQCTGPTVGDPDFDAGNAASEEATAAKIAFVRMWNPIARQEDLAQRTEDEI